MKTFVELAEDFRYAAIETIRNTEPGTVERYAAVNTLSALVVPGLTTARIRSPNRNDANDDSIMKAARDLLDASVTAKSNGGEWTQIATRLGGAILTAELVGAR